MRIPHARLAVVSLALLTVLFSPGSAFAAVYPNVWSGIVVTLSRLEGGKPPVLIVTGDMRPGIKEPLDVALAVPPGAKVIWAGEIAGTDPGKDIKQPFRAQRGTNFDLIAFPMKTFRQGQVEVELPKALTTSGGLQTASIDWVSATSLDVLQAEFLLPSNTTATSSTAGLVPRPETGGRLYYTERHGPNVPAGERIRSHLTFAAAGTVTTLPIEVAPSKEASHSGSEAPAPAIWPWFVLAAALVGVLLAWVFLFHRPQTPTE